MSYPTIYAKILTKHYISTISKDKIFQNIYFSFQKSQCFCFPNYQSSEVLERASCVFDYVEYTHRVRTYAEELPIEEAVEKAINECIQEGILKDFLEANRAEAIKVSIYEYNEQEHMRMEREDAFEDGRKAGLNEGRKLGLDEGLETGRNQLFELMNIMTADGLSNQLSRLSSEPDFYQEMLKKYLDT